jgi:hypothetical protein
MNKHLKCREPYMWALACLLAFIYGMLAGQPW